MLTRFASVTVLFQNYMLLSAAAALAAGGLYLLLVRTFRWDRQSRVRALGLFYGLGPRQRLAFSGLYLRLMFVLACLIWQTDIQAVHLIYLAAAGLVAGFLTASFGGLFQELVNSLLLGAGLLAGNLLIAYTKEIQFEWSIMAVYALLGCFILLYCLYFFIRDIRKLSEGRQENHVASSNEN